MVQAIQLEFLGVQAAIGSGFQFEEKRLAQVLEHQVARRRRLGALRPANGTFAFLLDRPPLLHTVVTNAVAAPEKNGVSEVILAHRAGELLTRNRPIERHCSLSAVEF